MTGGLNYCIELKTQKKYTMSDIVSRLSGSASPSEVIKELGYGCTVSKEYFKSVIGLMPPMDDRELCKVITVLAATRDTIDVKATSAALSAFAAAAAAMPSDAATVAAVAADTAAMLARAAD